MTNKIPSLSLLTLGLLSACSNTVPAAAPVVHERFARVALVPLEVGDTPQSLARAVGGTLLNWNDAGCEAGDEANCSAMVGLNPQVGAQSLHALSGRTVYIEPNRDVFTGGGTMTATMGGRITMWSGGRITMWSGGRITMWSGGQFSQLPENTALWKKIRLEEAQRMAPKLGAGVTVAVIDTGLDLQHPAFDGSLSDPSTWYDFYTGDATPQDEGTFGAGAYGHGTNVAGIVLQLAPAAKIMPLRVLGPDGSGDVVMVVQAIEWAVNHGAEVINLSLGTSENSKIIQKAIKKAMERDVLVVSSAGNENLNKITFPAAYAKGGEGKRALGVGSVDLNDVKSSFSNYSGDLRMVAPGENVYAPAPDARMAAWSGTSMAAPMASGGLALALGQGFSSEELIKTMTENAADVYEISANKPFRDRLGDKGRLDLVNFLTVAGTSKN
jgi:thermitase